MTKIRAVLDASQQRLQLKHAVLLQVIKGDCVEVYVMDVDGAISC